MRALIGIVFGIIIAGNASAMVQTLAQTSFNAWEGRTSFPVVVSLESDGVVHIEKHLAESDYQRGVAIVEKSFVVDEDLMEEFIKYHQELQNVEIRESFNQVNCVMAPYGLPEDLHIAADFDNSRSGRGLTLVHTQDGCWGPTKVEPANAADLDIAKEFKESLIRFAEQRI